MPLTPQDRMFHLSLNVTDLSKSVDFYKRLLGVEPTKHLADYAKFELTDPPLVLSLEPGRTNGQQRVNHLGIRVAGAEVLRTFADYAQESGLNPQYLQGVESCYARQTKICVTDPDENLVEFYIVEADLEKATDARGKITAKSKVLSEPVQISWEHLLGTRIPSQIPLENCSAHEVRLRGTLNSKRDTVEMNHLFSEVKRVLRPDGELIVQLFVSDREITKKLPALPESAVLVEFIPTEVELIAMLKDAGFFGIMLQHLSQSALFQFDGAQMRELTVTAALKPIEEPSPDRHSVVYKGPFREITDDFGVRYERGARTLVKPEVFAKLSGSLLAENFIFLNEALPGPCAAPIIGVLRDGRTATVGAAY